MEMIEAKHWREVDLAAWRWTNFSPAELASKGDGSIKLSCASLDKLQALREWLGVPLIVTSAYRDPEHNRRVGGAKHSQHLLGRAFDIRVDNVDPHVLLDAARMVGFTSFGTYPHKGFVHIDDRTEGIASWGKPFPERVVRFAPEQMPRPKTQALKEGGAVTLAVTAAERVVSDAAPLLPDHWVAGAFAVLGLVSLGVVLWRAFGRRGVVE